MMTQSDIIGVLLVYLYVGILLFIFDFISKKDSFNRRKIIHIMVGNIVFILPLFETRWVMVLLAAAPFILFTYLMSPHSPLGIESEASNSGHRLGLVYYSISWTLLAFLFFGKIEVIAVGIICMSYGDGLASLLGKNFGKHTFTITGDKKSIEGSASMIIGSFLMIAVTLLYFDALPRNLLGIPFVVSIATLTEILSIKGTDNLMVALISSIRYYILIYM